KRALIARGRKAEEVAAMPVLQVILLDALQQYRRLRDDVFKWVNVPYPQALAGWKRADDEVRAVVREHPAAVVFLEFLPAIQRVQAATLRLDRHVAALR